MSGESKDYATLKKNVCRMRDRIERIENVMVNGMPDVNYCIQGVEGWIEIKSPVEPKKSSTRLLLSNGNHPVSQDQKNWFFKQSVAGGNVFLLIATDKRWILVDNNVVNCNHEINNMSVEGLLLRKLWSAEKPIKAESWEQLIMCLKRKQL
jgi:hypothetical protein